MREVVIGLEVHAQVSLVLLLAALVGGKPAPVIDDNFVLNTVEMDLTLNTTVLRQKIAIDMVLRRDYMYAVGTLVEGAMEQIRRCDLHPTGWMSNAGGRDIAPATWQCDNATISRREEQVYCVTSTPHILYS